MASGDFGTGGSNRRVIVADASDLQNIGLGCAILVARPNSAAPSSNSVMMLKGTAGFRFRITTGGTLDFLRARATTHLAITANLTNFADWAAGKWLVIAVNWDTGGAAGAQMLMIWDITKGGLPSEPSSYGTQTVGSGAISSDVGSDLIIGNIGAFNAGFDGRLQLVAWFNTNLTPGEIAAWIFNQRRQANALFRLRIGYKSVSTVEDESGNQHTGTGTNVVAAPGAPLWVPNYARRRGSARHIVYPLGASLVKVVGETAQIAETSGQALGRVQMVDETAQLAEALSRARAQGRVLDETAQVAEALTRTLGLVTVEAETVQTTETAPEALGQARIVDETGQILEQAQPSGALARENDASVAIGEAEATALGRAQAVGETANLSETSAQAKGLAVVQDASVSLAEGLVSLLGLAPAVGETVQTSEASARARALARLQAEAESLVEALVTQAQLVRPVTETVTLAELAPAVRVLVRVTAETLSLAETLVRTLGGAVAMVGIRLFRMRPAVGAEDLQTRPAVEATTVRSRPAIRATVSLRKDEP